MAHSKKDILDNIKPQIREIVEGLDKGMILEDTWSLITDDDNGEPIIEQHTFSSVDNLDEIVKFLTEHPNARINNYDGRISFTVEG